MTQDGDPAAAVLGAVRWVPALSGLGSCLAEEGAPGLPGRLCPQCFHRRGTCLTRHAALLSRLSCHTLAQRTVSAPGGKWQQGMLTRDRSPGVLAK